MMEGASHIQTFALFGDDSELPDVVHVETIEARSRLHDWEFTPHRHGNLHQVLLLQSGGGEATLDGRALPLSDMKIINVPIGIVHGYRFDEGTRGHVVTLAAEVFDGSLRPSEGLAGILARPALIDAPEPIAETIRRIEAAFISRSFGRAQILRSLSGLLLGQIAQAMMETDDLAGPAATPPLLARFDHLIEQHYRSAWSVSDYARALAVTPTHLSRISRAATGRPASKRIEERLIREARRNLVYTNLPVSTIAYELGFDDPAYFSRVFSRATGLSPRAFRERAAA
ncbi:helix-turn-helix domain-containing protein [Marimonas arenosa]|nr:helix-turn-helix domain-containing protein [Marimonas arenosa]